MYYECPECKSKKKPKVVNFFPPIIVECYDCHTRGYEKNFVRPDPHSFNALPSYP